jgi:translation initiation factor IF-2
MKVQQLARELGVDTRAVLDYLKASQKVKNPMASLTPDIEAAVRSHFKPEAPNGNATPAASGVAVTAEGKVLLPPSMSVKELGEYLNVSAVDILKELMRNGIMASINQQIDYDTAAIVADAFKVQAAPMEMDSIVPMAVGDDDESTVRLTVRSELVSNAGEDPLNLQTRPPVVTVMGHVDHGKTSLLDAIRETKVAAGEAGGITQSIGAYAVETRGRKVVFLDTPGHEAFTAMRARGAQVTDVAVLVVAADDGVMPQTREAISHAKAAGVPILVAINKIDKEGANPERVKQELAELTLVPEAWGGKTVMVEVSAKQKRGLDDLLEMILLVADLQELKANPNRPAVGTIIDAHLEKGRGPVATVLVQSGTLRVGDNFVVGALHGKVRALLNEFNKKMKEAGPATPAVVAGLPAVPTAGDIFQVVASEKVARTIAQQRTDIKRHAAQQMVRTVTLADFSSQIEKGEIKDLNLVLKADSNGSMEALRQAILKIQDPKVRVKVAFEGVGAVSESDVLLAAVSNAPIIAYNVKPDAAAVKAAEREKVDIRTYEVVYNVTDDVTKAIKGMYEPVFVQVFEGRGEVLKPIRIPKLGMIAGSRITEGKVTRGSVYKLFRGKELLKEGKILTLKRFKDDAREVPAGQECGIGLEAFQDVQEGDLFEFYALQRES